MRSIFDERDQGEQYWQGLELRMGKTGERKVEEYQKNNKNFKEADINRGFDILRTWDIKNYLNH